MSEVLRVLQIEDSASDATLVVRTLVKAGYSVHAESVEDAHGLRAALKAQTWDVILSDHCLPRFDAPAALFILHEIGLDIPFLVISGAIGEDLAVALMRSGAHDYLMKDSLARLAPAVAREISYARARADRRVAAQALRDSEEQLHRQAALLQQKETLLREIHHRVKNNMQVMSSLLSLQARTVLQPEVSRMLQDNQNRIQSMALLHEILYESDDLATVDFPKYVLRMLNQLFRSYGVDDKHVRLRSEFDALALDLDEALPLGLLINEVVSNSLKHAFPQGRNGEVYIGLRRQSNGDVALVLSDDGIGLPDDLDCMTSPSLGLRLVRTLAQQLRAKLDIRSPGGAEVSVTFTPVRKLDKSPDERAESLCTY